MGDIATIGIAALAVALAFGVLVAAVFGMEPIPSSLPAQPHRNPGDNANCTQCGASFFSTAAITKCDNCLQLSINQAVAQLNQTTLSGPRLSLIFSMLRPSVQCASARAGIDIRMAHDSKTDDFIFMCMGTEVGRLPRSDIVSGAYKTTFNQVLFVAQQKAAAISKRQQQWQQVSAAQQAALQQVYQQAYQPYSGQISGSINTGLGGIGGSLLGMTLGSGGSGSGGGGAVGQAHLTWYGAQGGNGSMPSQPTRPTVKPSLATSDQLETFIRYLESEGIPEKVARKVSLNVFIVWTVAEAEKAEGDPGKGAARLAEIVAQLKAEHQPVS